MCVALAAGICSTSAVAFAQQMPSDTAARQTVQAAASTGSILPATGDDLGMGIIVLTALGVFCLIVAFLVLIYGIRSAKKKRGARHHGTTRTPKL